MGSEWESVQLGDYCTKIGSGATPKGGSSVYQENGEICLIRSQNIYNEGFIQSGLVYIDEAAATKLKNVEVEEKDILLNITGDSVARVCLAPTSYLPARVNQHVAIIRPNPGEFDARFLRYQLVSQKMQQLLLNLASAGATRNALTKGMIETFEVSKPPLSVQVGIADLLESIDNKITLNRQINHTLEQMAQTLFKSWFVDFDPVIDNALDAGNAIPDELQARAEQRQALRDAATQQSDASATPAGSVKPLPDNIRQLFPNEFEESELGWVPKGWEQSFLSDFGKIVTGKTPSKSVGDAYSDFGDGNLPFITPTDIGHTTHLLFTSRYLTQSGQAAIAKSRIESGSICVTCIGSQMGKTILVNKPAFTNQQINTLLPDSKEDMAFLFCNLRLRRSELLRMGSSGSTMPILNKSAFSQVTILTPSPLLRSAFSEYVSAMFEKIISNMNSNFYLEKLRDTLLPKLISGELRLDEVESTIEETITV